MEHERETEAVDAVPRETYREIFIRRAGLVESKEAKIDAKINGVETTVAVDSGASLTLLDPSFLEKKNVSMKVHTLQRPIKMFSAGKDQFD